MAFGRAQQPQKKRRHWGVRALGWTGKNLVAKPLLYGTKHLVVRPALWAGKKAVTTKTGRKILIGLASAAVATGLLYKHYPKETTEFAQSAGRLAGAVGKDARNAGMKLAKKALRRGRKKLEKESAWARKFFQISDDVSGFMKERFGLVEKQFESFTPEDIKDFESVKFRTPSQTLSQEKAVGRLPLYRNLLKHVEPKDRATVYRMIATDFSKVYGVDPLLSISVMDAESNFNPRAKSWADAQGLMQIVPETGNADIREFKLRKIVGEPAELNLYDPLYNIDGGISYLDFLRDKMKENSRGGTEQQFMKWGVMAYNAGYSGLTSGRTAKSGANYWRAVSNEYRKWGEINPDSFEQELRIKYSRFFSG